MPAPSNIEASRWKRSANERLRAASQPLPSDALVPFICECDDPWCLGRVDVALLEYDYARDSGDLVRLAEHQQPSVPRVHVRRLR
jgi:hypothetical protein